MVTVLILLVTPDMVLLIVPVILLTVPDTRLFTLPDIAPTGSVDNWLQAVAAAVPNLPALATNAPTSPTAVLVRLLAIPLMLVKVV